MFVTKFSEKFNFVVFLICSFVIKKKMLNSAGSLCCHLESKHLHTTIAIDSAHSFKSQNCLVSLQNVHLGKLYFLWQKGGKKLLDL